MKRLLGIYGLVFLMGSLICLGCKEEAKDMSMKMNNPRNIRGVISYKRSFGDLNAVQLATAKKIGIRPIGSREEAVGLGERLIHIVPCERYDVDSLTHSIPYLIPQASALLDTIGVNFLDSLENKGVESEQGNRHFGNPYQGRCETVAPHQRKRFVELLSFLRYDVRFELETFCQGGRPGWPSHAGCECRYLEAGVVGGIA